MKYDFSGGSPRKRVGNRDEGPELEALKRGVLAVWNSRLRPSHPEYIKDWAAWEKFGEANGAEYY